MELTNTDKYGNLYIDFGKTRITYLRSKLESGNDEDCALKIQNYKEGIPGHNNELEDGVIIICSKEYCKAVYNEISPKQLKEKDDSFKAPVNSVVLGQLVRLKIETMGCKVGTIGVCYHTYHIVQPGCQVIFPNGEYCGFSLDEQSNYFELGQILPKYCDYIFKSVMIVSQQYHDGLFTDAFAAKFVPVIPKI